MDKVLSKEDNVKYRVEKTKPRVVRPPPPPPMVTNGEQVGSASNDHLATRSSSSGSDGLDKLPTKEDNVEYRVDKTAVQAPPVGFSPSRLVILALCCLLTIILLWVALFLLLCSRWVILLSLLY